LKESLIESDTYSAALLNCWASSRFDYLFETWYE